MEKYNRDLYTKGLESYEVPQYEPGYKPLDFVFGFVAGAILGSALGFILKPNIAQSKRTKNQFYGREHAQKLREDAIRKAEALKSEARRIKDETAQASPVDEGTVSEHAAQLRAIRSEVDSDRLQAPSVPNQASKNDEIKQEPSEKQKEANHIDTEQQGHRQAVFENGVITHDIESQQQTAQKKTETTTVDKQKSEDVKKLNKKVGKHTFND
ncbi:hypothetical protein [Staphylococcus lutrae]|uniref:YtxH domain-containing protein n=1 Tax=Staphylococcus lutrae TaxID=155085 RepID=A0AAC9WIJ6_9STAP|nr:hypothetical protein [Staphylococcus lutrae]ARJ50025.1 hypothetical protein B5P37_00975 [Staphylococcus lutrae]ARJ51944.1 hypothetical protein B5P37_11770 [Staphylococcus lutrae]PNZ38972.1 hypothetical protein CD134_02830 [Staphylococcus lutrae]